MDSKIRCADGCIYVAANESRLFLSGSGLVTMDSRVSGSEEDFGNEQFSCREDTAVSYRSRGCVSRVGSNKSRNHQETLGLHGSTETATPRKNSGWARANSNARGTTREFFNKGNRKQKES